MSATATCPYCNTLLKKIPQRLTKCPVCAKPIYVRRTPESRDKKLMTDAQAQANEAAWAQHTSASMIERAVINGAAVMGLDATRALTEIQSSDNPNGIWERMVSMRAVSAENLHQRKMACLLLADIKARNGDASAFGLLRDAALLELKILAEKASVLPNLKAQILPGGGESRHEICRAMRAQPAVTIAEELRNPRLPNPMCPMSRGALDQGFCTCMYVPWMDGWKVQHPPGS